MEDTRPLKRARQACDPCRRKKSKCPGERPVCSYCQRLGQQCVYNDQESDINGARHNQKMERRIDNLEAKMDRLIEQLLPITTAAASQRPPPEAGVGTPGSLAFSAVTWPAAVSSAGPRPEVSSQTREDRQQLPFALVSSSGAAGDLLLDEAGLRAAGQVYLTWCHSQPIVLFREETFLETLRSRDRQLLLALQALSLRFPPGVLTSERQGRLAAMTNESRGLAMNSVVNSHVELSTLQTLCLLSWIDFADGKPILAEMNIGIAASLTNSLQPGCALGDPQECSDCIRSISMVQHLQGCVSNNTRLSNALTMPHSPSVRSGFSDCWTTRDSAAALDALPPTQLDGGILKYTTQLSEVWHMARTYAASVVTVDAPPPWNSQSDYSSVMQRHLEIDSQVPLKYRFYANKVGDKTAESLQQRRHYWGSYFFLQIIYATIPCLLNHPFLLSMRLRNFRHTMPQAFIQQSFELITRHAGWIIYFFDTLDKKALQLSDPTLAHCAVIIATIHLQHSFVQDKALRDRSQAGFDKCMKFLRNMGTIWPSVSVMADNLQKLQDSVVMLPSQDAGDGYAASEQQSLSIDSKLLWDMLIYERAGRNGAAPDQSIFGPSLAQIPSAARAGTHDTVVAEYDLVGSAGISGHKTVPKESPIYAPEDTTIQRNPSPMIHGTTAVLVPPYSIEDRYMNGIDGESSYEALFFQANDFGRAIDEWMSHS